MKFLFFQNNAASSLWGWIQHLPKAVAKELLTALRGSALGTNSLANTACLLVFEDF